MTEAVATIKGRKLDARYTLLDKLGAGGQGEVWRAHDGTRGVDVALKVLNPSRRQEEAWSALEHEYAIASRLDHPSILKVFPPERSGDALVLPMELASGGDLRRLRGAGFLEIIPVLLEIAQALEHAHERGVVHRDLKPGNVLFDARGRARLADFGVAETSMSAVEGEGSVTTAATRDTNKHGFSPFTASPAQLRGEPPTPADDIYGLGALAYELLSGYPPYYPHFDKKRAIEERVPTLVPTRQIPPLLAALVTHMLEKDPKRRPRTMREVIDELDAALNDTLTFDFESVSPTAPTSLASSDSPQAGSSLPTPQQAGTSRPSPQGAATQASRPAAGNTPDAQAKQFVWTPSSQERRANPDRRGRRREDSAPQKQREPTISSDLSEFGGADRGPTWAAQSSQRLDIPSRGLDDPAGTGRRTGAGVAANDTGTQEAVGARGTNLRASNAGASLGGAPVTSHRSGAEVLARIDAEIERASAEVATSRTSFWSKEPRDAPAGSTPAHHAPLTPAEAAAIVAAARAAARQSPPERTPGTTYSTPPADSRSAPSHPAASPAAASRTLTHAVPASRATTTPAPTPPASMTSHAAASQPTPSHPAATHAPPFLNPTPIHTGPMHATWGEIPLDGLPKVARLEPIRVRRWPWVFLGLIAGGAAAVYFWLPRFDPETLPPEVAAVVEPLKSALNPDSSASQTPASTVAAPSAAPAQSADATTATSATSAASTPTKPTAPVFTAAEEQRLRTMRQTFDDRIAALEARGAGVWGGHEFAMAKTRAAESVGARDAGNPRMAQERLATAMKLLDTVESRAPQALSAQVAAGEKALGTGQQEVAGQAFDLARRINPNDRRASDGLRRAQNLNAVLPLLADAQNAEAGHDYARAAQDYSQALFLDPVNATAKAGQARANAAFGDDNYAKAVGTGFAALGAGRLDQAHDAFIKARALKPNGAEAAEGLKRVGAALTARGFASMRQRAVGLEAQERWDEAERAYDDVLSADSSLAFAQEGKARSSSRAELSGRLQQLIDRPDRLASAGVREEARSLLETARAQSPSGPVLRSQIARLEILLPGFDKPVRLSLLSDNSTQVVISSIGSFGAFSRRDIELRPGRYTVVGTRNGFRDVRREITVAPGQEIQTIKVTCSDPI